MDQGPARGTFDDLLPAFKKAVGALNDREIPFAVGGSLAAFVRGAPPPSKDVDLLVDERDAEAAARALADAGMRIERPAEGWLLKAWDGEVLIDLIHGPTGVPVTRADIARWEEVPLLAVPVRVMPLEDLFTSKLLALGEHTLDLAPLLRHARALRECVDWEAVRTRTDHHPYAHAFFALVDALGLVTAPGRGAGQAGVPDPRGRVRVVGEAPA
jgi:hypothetical protein